MHERDIFLAAIEIAHPDERVAYLDQACAGNAALRAQVEELLKTHAETSQFLETPAAASNSGSEHTVITDSTDDEGDSHERSSSGEAEFRKYLQPSTRPGWLGRLAHYEIEEILGRGAFGIVAKAFDEKLHRVVAIKLMSPDLATTSPPRKRFLREARTAAAVTHENIVAIHAVEEEPIPYLVMEFIPGQTLQQRMEEHGPLDLAEVLRIGQQVASGLAAAHAANLIHRDIKPANILLTGGIKEKAKISDFGLARAVDDATMTSSGVIAGTPMYMAPEQARGEPLDHRADLFSLGSVLYQMVCGRPPFRAANTVAVLKRVCEDTPRPLDDVIPETPDWLEAIIFRLLEKQRDDRYQSAQEVADLLARCQSELEHNGKVTCVQERSGTSETMVFQANKPAESLAKPKWSGWMVGGLLAITTLAGLTMLNPEFPLGVRVSNEVSEKTSNRSSGHLKTTKSENLATTNDSGFIGDRKFFSKVTDLNGQTLFYFDPKLSSNPEAILAASKLDNGSRLIVDSQKLTDQADLSLMPSVFLRFSDPPIDNTRFSELVDLILGRPSQAAPISLQILSNALDAEGFRKLAGTPIGNLELTGIPFESEKQLGILRGIRFKGPVKLGLNQAGLSDNLIAELTEFPNLQEITWLSVTQNDLTDQSLEELSRLKQLEIVELSGTQVTRSGIDRFRVAIPTCKVYWDGKVIEPLKGDPSTYPWPTDAPKPAIAPFDAEQAKQHQAAWAAYLKVPVEYTNNIGMKFRLIPPGEFLMVSTPEEIEAALKVAGENEAWRELVSSEAPQHKVILTQPVYVGVTEVTQTQYELVMGTNPSHFSATGEGKDLVANLVTSNHPVEMVSWNDAAEFCAKLCQQEKLNPFYFRSGDTITPLDGNGYRLPTDAEWEFTCRAGTTTRFWSGDTDQDLNQVSWFSSNSGGRTHAAGELKANPFGLSDVHGNVWEWVQDSWDPVFHGKPWENAAVDPSIPFVGDSQRVIRGGNWLDSPSYCRSSYRYAYPPANRHFHVGFRVSLSVAAVREAIQKSASKSPSSPTVETSGWHGWPADAPKPAIAPFDAEQAKKHQEAWAAYLKVPVEYENSIGMKFRLIPPGEFTMGSTPEEIAAALQDVDPNDLHWQACIQSSAPQHKVILTQPIYLAATEVTQSQYEKIMGNNPSFYSATGPGKEAVANLMTENHPVEMVSWIDAAEFCAKLSQKETLMPFYFRSGARVTSLDGTGYRLPKEAEWEYACRAGTTTRFWSGHDDRDLMMSDWVASNSGGRPHAVGELEANPFGLYDVHGNVWERVEDCWASDFYKQFEEQPAINPIAPCPDSTNPQRVIKGGRILAAPASLCLSALRFATVQRHLREDLGFRVALTVDAVKEAIANKSGPSDNTGWHGWPADAPAPAIAPFDAEQAKKHQEEWAAYLKVPVEYTNSIGMKFRLIPPGEFLMGSTPEEIAAALPTAGEDTLWQDCIKSEGPQHRVVLTQPSYLGVHEVTQHQYQQVASTNPSYFAASGLWAEYVMGIETSHFPVEGVSWDKASAFCRGLSEKEQLNSIVDMNVDPTTSDPAGAYRLPTEAEWEFACRAGTRTLFYTGNTSAESSLASWNITSSDDRTHVVGEKQSNAFGLFDMHGNVWEWALDAWDPAWYATLSEHPAVNPLNPPAPNSERMIRGGNYGSAVSSCRSASRCSESSSYNATLIGFRVLLPVNAVRQLLKSPVTRPAP